MLSDTERLQLNNRLMLCSKELIALQVEGGGGAEELRLHFLFVFFKKITIIFLKNIQRYVFSHSSIFKFYDIFWLRKIHQHPPVAFWYLNHAVWHVPHWTDASCPLK